MLDVSFDFQGTVTRLLFNVMHLLTVQVSFALVMKFANLQLTDNVDFHQVGRG